METGTPVDVTELRAKVQQMYQDVARRPHGTYHFEMGRVLAERLGYPAPQLDRIPDGAIESFAGVGYFFDLAGLTKGERVLDLGSGSGMDSFFAAFEVGRNGHVTGVDMTPAQLEKAGRLRDESGVTTMDFVEGRIEDLPFPDATFDLVISNGVINLAPDKAKVFGEAARVVRPGGRLAIADIVTETQLTDGIISNADLWASCIGGAAHQDTYLAFIEEAGFRIAGVPRVNPYQFISERALNASAEYGVKSLSLLAHRS